ncbi:MAG TPA: metallophosphoesterase [Candidatus Polarisedimenticolia bacterium]|nr:metallophosphoesterase [Candidatus Polarisedimenticolia bacterium]
MNDGQGPVALLGDAHLFDEDPEVPAFINFIDTLPADIGTLIILGDLFSAWIGRRELQRPHHMAVVEALRRLRSQGRRILYIEGNHDFFLARLFSGDPFERLAERSLDLRLGGRRVHLAHGDLVNRRDRQYLAWRAVSKSRAFYTLFNLLPAATRHGIVEGLEQRMAGTNLAFRGGFPYAECEAYASRQMETGAEILVFGHFHQELRIDYHAGERRATAYVLPAWRRGHIYLRLAPGSEPAFVSS